MTPAARAAVRAVVTACAASVALSGLAGCYVDVGALRQQTHEYSVPGQVHALVVHSHVGGVHVTGSGSGPVVVTEHLTFRHAAPVTTHRVSAGTLTLGNSCPALETCSVRYDIRVPRTLAVRITDNVGTILLRSLSGPVTAHTNAGGIDLDSLSGPVEATGRAGTILGRDVSSARVTLSMSAGRIDVTFSAPPESLTATMVAGPVSLRVPGTVPYAVSVHASVGRTRVSVTRSPASPHVITASTTTGTVTIAPAP